MDVLKRYHKIQMKTPLPEPLLMKFNLQSATFLKSVYIAKCSRKPFFIEHCFIEHQATVSKMYNNALENWYFPQFIYVFKAVARRCSVKKVFLEISLNSQENTCARVSFLVKFQAIGLHIFCVNQGNHHHSKIVYLVFLNDFD